MAKRYPKGSESRLSREGLRGVTTGSGKVVRAVYAHGESRRTRTVIFTDGSKENWPIYDLVGALISNRGE